ncbi:Hypothetical_protein [Hexamita inflata]|uniref:Hypothetical_protein n=1 Tax=Hexamita inflata TaxID=28002 RepID=A0AA86RNN1_9EUKA|nr:Hypothetical protein HINF_LOCUS62827 [Hexamita inflata]
MNSINSTPQKMYRLNTSRIIESKNSFEDLVQSSCMKSVTPIIYDEIVLKPKQQQAYNQKLLRAPVRDGEAVKNKSAFTFQLRRQACGEGILDVGLSSNNFSFEASKRPQSATKPLVSQLINDSASSVFLTAPSNASNTSFTRSESILSAHVNNMLQNQDQPKKQRPHSAILSRQERELEQLAKQFKQSTQKSEIKQISQSLEQQAKMNCYFANVNKKVQLIEFRREQDLNAKFVEQKTKTDKLGNKNLKFMFKFEKEI